MVIRELHLSSKEGLGCFCFQTHASSTESFHGLLVRMGSRVNSLNPSPLLLGTGDGSEGHRLHLFQGGAGKALVFVPTWHSSSPSNFT